MIILFRKTRDIENDPANIESQITDISNGFRLKMRIVFGCQAEVVLFQMALRNIEGHLL